MTDISYHSFLPFNSSTASELNDEVTKHGPNMSILVTSHGTPYRQQASIMCQQLCSQTHERWAPTCRNQDCIMLMFSNILQSSIKHVTMSACLPWPHILCWWWGWCMFALWHKRPLLIPLPAVCRHLWHQDCQVRKILNCIKEWNLEFQQICSMKSSYNSNIMILEVKAFTLESSRETVSCPATLFLLVSLLGIGDVNRLTGRHVCENRSAYIIMCQLRHDPSNSKKTLTENKT